MKVHLDVQDKLLPLLSVTGTILGDLDMPKGKEALPP